MKKSLPTAKGVVTYDKVLFFLSIANFCTVHAACGLQRTSHSSLIRNVHAALTHIALFLYPHNCVYKNSAVTPRICSCRAPITPPQSESRSLRARFPRRAQFAKSSALKTWHR